MKIVHYTIFIWLETTIMKTERTKFDCSPMPWHHVCIPQTDLTFPPIPTAAPPPQGHEATKEHISFRANDTTMANWPFHPKVITIYSSCLTLPYPGNYRIRGTAETAQLRTARCYPQVPSCVEMRGVSSGENIQTVSSGKSPQMMWCNKYRQPTTKWLCQ